ncbi:hypothetical protein K788_0002463 [Paraburkholderia caribensis MBA4]|uniref:Uncharacterized protein n=1 Tax=Paraburkholderia caribensis MBA4 TaxID=1323664 RepID=A0A0P0R9B9_9BURK|nr:hypothetical protein K788_0002463 [Paraburkholderia caribensis MBA4]
MRTDSRIQHSPRRPMHAFLEAGQRQSVLRGIRSPDRANGASHASQHLGIHAIDAADAALLLTPRKSTHPEAEARADCATALMAARNDTGIHP